MKGTQKNETEVWRELISAAQEASILVRVIDLNVKDMQFWAVNKELQDTDWEALEDQLELLGTWVETLTTLAPRVRAATSVSF